MAAGLGVLYILVGFFLAGLYAGATPNTTLWDKASIALLWLPGIAYVVGYRIGKESKQQENP